MNLKPCPFCGGEAWLDKRSATVHCEGCLMQKSAPCPAAPDDVDAAVDAWNTRVPGYRLTSMVEVLPYQAAVFYEVNSSGEWVPIQEVCE